MKIWFADYWGGFNPLENHFTRTLIDGLGYELSSVNPDLLVYSVFGNSHLNYNCKKIFWTGENVRPDFSHCDLALTFDYNDDDRHFRLPLYALTYWEFQHLMSEREEVIPAKFCAFMYGNLHQGTNGWGNFQDGVVKRVDIFNKLSKYKKVDSCGSANNNIGFMVPRGGEHKIDFLKSYKFTFAIENTSNPGYVTEKIIEPFFSNSVPIYWGSDRIHEEFNRESFINCHDFKSNDDIVEFIVELDKNPDLYQKMKKSPFIASHNEHLDFSRVINFIRNNMNK
jgi:hypothetical protein